jgi:asparagine synthase (glutamine-hydrolysing)
VSRIVSLFHRDGRPVDAAVLQSLAAPMRHGASDRPNIWASGRVGLSHQGAERAHSNSTSSDPAGRLTFDGRLDNREELLAALPTNNRQPRELSDAALVFECYRAFGDAFVARLNGDFAFSLWDDSKQQLVLARDLIGVRPLYYWTSGRTFIAASEIKAILAHPDVDPRPDDEGLADALLGGNPNDLRLTCFRDVRRVVPGSTIIVSADRIRESRHRDFDPAKQTRCASIGEYAEVLRGLFEQAVRRRLRRVSAAPVGVLVSGGLDSSAILCQGQRLQEAGAAVAPTLGVSWVFPDGVAADEKQLLGEIETQHRVVIHRLPFSTIRLLDEERWLWTTEFPRLRWDSEAACLGLLRDQGCSTVLDGYFGDQMMSSDAPLFELVRGFRVLEMRREFDALARSMLDSPASMLRREYAHYFLWEIAPDRALRVLRALRRRLGRDRRPRWFTRTFRDLAYRRSQQQRRALGPFGGKHAELVHRCFVPTHRLNMLEELNKLAAAHGLERAYPFMDRDLVEFMMAIPGHVVTWEGSYKGLFREAMRGVLPESIRRRYWKADFTLVANAAAADGYSRFQTYFQPDCLSATMGYLERDMFAMQFERYQSQLTGESIQPPSQVSAVVGLELWLRAFFGGAEHAKFAQA